ncbi:MlaD family protein [Nocardia terpenica]|uniref:MCE family protein n=1 Tax=Nocardia terpenica TaxID=455432 RepID=A0A6G9ZDA8_9NOCA|nr:MlaD family protein [Nocardia terpenica]QIS23381.1 MCE family protein [Nocardia terpenica]
MSTLTASSVRSRVHRLLRPHDGIGGTDRHEAARLRRELRYGVAGAVVLVTVLAVAAVLSVLPIGATTYTADLTEARSVAVGDDIRLAGIHVGSVASLRLLPDRVRMTFTVDHGVFLGDRTSLEVRMLTMVGGHYIAVFPAGDRRLGAATIPVDRVRLPYSLIQTLQDAATPVAQVDANTLRENFSALRESLSSSPDALRRMGTALESFVGILDRQNAQVSQALTVMDEYLTTVDENKALLGVFVRQIGLLETEGLDKQAEIKLAVRIGTELLARIAAVEPVWREQLEPLADKLVQMLPQLKDIGARLGRVVANLGDLRHRLQNAVHPGAGITVDQSAVTIPASSVCVPVPGKGC